MATSLGENSRFFFGFYVHFSNRKAIRKGHLPKSLYHYILVLSTQNKQYIVFALDQHLAKNGTTGIGVLRSPVAGWTVNEKKSAWRGYLLAYRVLICDLAVR